MVKVRVMVSNASSPIFQIYRGRQFYWWRKLEFAEKNTDLPQVTDKLHHMTCLFVLVSKLAWRQKYETLKLKLSVTATTGFANAALLHTYPGTSLLNQALYLQVLLEIEQIIGFLFGSQNTHWKWYYWIVYYKMDIDHRISAYTGNWRWCTYRKLR